MKITLPKSTLVSIGLFALASSASAIITSSTDSSDFNLTSEDFAYQGSSVPSLTSLSTNLTLIPAFGIGNPAAGNMFYSGWTSALTGNEMAINGDENFDLVFSSLQTAFAMDYVDDSTDSVFTLNFFNGAINVGGTSFTTSSPFDVANFIGFSSDTAFDKVTIREEDGSVNSNEYFQFYTATSAVPDSSSTAVLFGMGVLGLAFIRRKFSK